MLILVFSALGGTFPSSFIGDPEGRDQLPSYYSPLKTPFVLHLCTLLIQRELQHYGSQQGRCEWCEEKHYTNIDDHQHQFTHPERFGWDARENYQRELPS